MGLIHEPSRQGEGSDLRTWGLTFVGFLLSFCRGCSLGPLQTNKEENALAGQDRGSHGVQRPSTESLTPSCLSPSPQPPAPPWLLNQTGKSWGGAPRRSRAYPLPLDCLKSEPLKLKSNQVLGSSQFRREIPDPCVVQAPSSPPFWPPLSSHCPRFPWSKATGK